MLFFLQLHNEAARLHNVMKSWKIQKDAQILVIGHKVTGERVGHHSALLHQPPTIRPAKYWQEKIKTSLKNCPSLHRKFSQIC